VTSAGSCFADVAPAPHGRVSPDPRLSPAVCAAAWPPAIAATRAGSRVFGSTAASNAAPGISARNLCAGRCATPVVYLWSRYRLPLYARRVPWEVVAPLGAARGGSLHPPRALTHSRSDLTQSPFAIPPTSRGSATAPCHWRKPLAEHGRKRRKETKTCPLRNAKSSGTEGDGEGDGSDKIWLERKQRRRRSG